MSVHVMSWVLKQSEAKLGARLVLLVLADHAKDDGSAAWPSLDTIAHEARMSKRAVQDALKRLEGEREIQQTGVSRAGTKIWRVVMGVAETATGGGSSPHPSVSSTATEPSIEPSPSSLGSAQTREPVEFSEWMGHHREVTGLSVLKAGTKAREHIASMFGARLAEGYSLDDLKAAVDAAWADEFRRRHGHVDPESVLRPTKVGKLVAAGLKLRSSSPAAAAERELYGGLSKAEYAAKLNAEAIARTAA